MDDQKPIITQYQIFSERKLHFGRLFWQIPGVFLALLVALVGVFKDIQPPLLWWLIFISGLFAVEICYISYRIRGREDEYELLMRNIESTLKERYGPDIQFAPLSKTHGSRFAVTVSFGAFGVMLATLGLFKIFNG